MKKGILGIAFAPLLFGLLVGCEAYAVVDADKPIVVKRIISENSYRVHYNDGKNYMIVKTKDSLNVGDTILLERTINIPRK